MPAANAVPRTKPEAGRQRSRYGCRNCKLRKLKCDEAKPHCKRCTVYGVLCNFEYGVRDLQSITEKKPEDAVQKHLMPLRPIISQAIWSSDGTTVFILDPVDQLLFRRYRDRTMYSIGGKAMAEAYGKNTLRSAFRYPCLMHALLAVAAIHDRYLGLAPSNKRSVRELSHWSECTTNLAKMLSGPIKEEYKDACWATASKLGILTFASAEADPTERQPWPLGPEDPTDLEWLRLGAGKMKLWKLLNPLRPESSLKPIAGALSRISAPLPAKGIDGVPPELVRFCGLDRDSTLLTNPYFNVVHGLAELQQAQDPLIVYADSLRVQGQMCGAFQNLLHDKDPIALTLLFMWYNYARKTKWWIEMRAKYEHGAIYNYLKHHHGDNVALQRLLKPLSKT